MPKMKVNPKLATPVNASREAEIAKTARLRLLRLAKEAADKEAAAREAAASTGKSRRRRHDPVLQPTASPDPA